MSIEEKRSSLTSSSHLTRFKPTEVDQIARVRELRREAESLRNFIALHGRYNTEEANRFWALCRNASFALDISNSELSERSGLGASFFTSVVRDKRKPKLDNFLRTLGVVVEVANERLAEVDRIDAEASPDFRNDRTANLTKDEQEQILQLSKSLAFMAREEIVKIRSTPANHPETLEQQNKQISLLEIFAVGFEKITEALSKFPRNAKNRTSPLLLKKAVDEVGDQLDVWWMKNAGEAMDWAIRIPVIVSGIAALGWAGANMAVGTTVISTLVGGSKVLDALKKRKGKQA